MSPIESRLPDNDPDLALRHAIRFIHLEQHKIMRENLTHKIAQVGHAVFEGYVTMGTAAAGLPPPFGGF
ncbi:MAG TPA: hypothetical protein VGF75_06930 [Candidatus Saccharimonadales bacterium]